MPVLYDEVGTQLAGPRPISATIPATATSGTIATAGVGVSRVLPAAAITAVVLQKGTFQGQQVIVENQGLAASTITFDVVANSFVADGVTTVIAGLRCGIFVWDQAQQLWYRS